MGNPYKPGTPEWQDYLNAEIAKHDAENKERDAKIDAENQAKAQEAVRKADEAAKGK